MKRELLGSIIVCALSGAAGVSAEIVVSGETSGTKCGAPKVFPGDCVDTLGAIGDPSMRDPGEGFLHVKTPVVDPLLILSADRSERRLYALNPLGNRVRVFAIDDDMSTLADIRVCSRPSALARNESGSEVYVACHGSHAVAVIDTDRNVVTAMIQDRDPSGRPLLSEPMGMVERDGLLYVASSQNNRLAIVDLSARRVLRYLDLPGQDPRALALAPGRRFLVVANFLSGNRTEPLMDFSPAVLDPETAVGSVCAPLFEDPTALAVALEEDPGFMDTSHPRFATIAECYLFAHTFGSTSTIAIQPARSDHDLVVVDLEREEIAFTTSSLGTDLGSLIYDVRFQPGENRLYVASTMARNDLNSDFGNRPLINRIAILDLDPTDGSLAVSEIRDLDHARLDDTGRGNSISATPHAVAVSGSRVLIAASGSDRLIIADSSRIVSGSVAVGFTPKGVVTDGARAWIHDSGSFEVTVVDLATASVLRTVSIGSNPLSQAERIGEHLFESAQFASNRSFACASCHPDGNIDGLVWRLNETDGLRTTMTATELTETAPYHWDGSKRDLVQILGDGVRDLFRTPGSPDRCQTETMIAFIEGLVRPHSPYRPADDSFSEQAALGGALMHRARFKNRDDQPRLCSHTLEDPSIEARYLSLTDDPAKKAFRFNGGGGPFPATSSAESCSIANCHATPHDESDGFLNGDPELGRIDGYQAVSTHGLWDRIVTQHDARTTRTRFVQALDANRRFHGASAMREGDHLTGRLATRSFNDAHFRHAEFNFDADPTTHGFKLSDAITQYMMEEEDGPSGAVGLSVVLRGERSSPPQTKRLLDLLMSSARQGKIVLHGVGTSGGSYSVLDWNAEDGKFIVNGRKRVTLDRLTTAMKAKDSMMLFGVLPPNDGEVTFPKLRSISRGSSPILCSEGYDEYPATVAVRETNADLILRGRGLVDGTRVLVNGQVAGEPLSGPGPDYVWRLPHVPDRATILSLQLFGAGGMMSNGLPLPVIDPVRPPREPGDLHVMRDGDAATLTWTDPSRDIAPGTRYDVFRGRVSDLMVAGFVAGECVSPNGWARPRLLDAELPPAGDVFYYLVRAQNQVDRTSWGTPRRDEQSSTAPHACEALFPEATYAGH